MGASLLVFLNKTDVEHCMDEQEVREVGFLFPPKGIPLTFTATGFGFHQNPQVDDPALQCNDRHKLE
jgi:hypothetical protein